MKTTTIFSLLSFFLLCTACQDDDDANLLPANCAGELIQIVTDPNAPVSDNFAVTAATVTDRCLSLTLSATGCGTDAWSANLLTDGAVDESLPTQTTARIVLDDGIPSGGVTCQAEVSRTFVFDLSPYLNDGALPTRLTLTGTGRVLEIE